MSTRIAIAVEELAGGQYLVADHFGRCSRFAVYEVNEKKLVTHEERYLNPLVGNHGGACQLPHYVREFNVDVIIAGGMGRKAISLFNHYNIVVITAPGAKVENALHGYLQGDMTGYEECGGHKNKCSD